MLTIWLLESSGWCWDILSLFDKWCLRVVHLVSRVITALWIMLNLQPKWKVSASLSECKQMDPRHMLEKCICDRNTYNLLGNIPIKFSFYIFYIVLCLIQQTTKILYVLYIFYSVGSEKLRSHSWTAHHQYNTKKSKFIATKNRTNKLKANKHHR